MPRHSWVLLSSRLPREPSRLRLAAWRRLKRLGAVLLHDAVWILPADPATREAVEWLADEIEEQGGTTFVWEAADLSSAQDRRLVEVFREEANARYAEIGATARAIGRAMRRRTRARRFTEAARAQAIRQVHGLERALRLEYRRDYFRAPERSAAAAAVSEAGATLTKRQPTTRQRGAAHAVGH